MGYSLKIITFFVALTPRSPLLLSGAMLVAAWPLIDVECAIRTRIHVDDAARRTAIHAAVAEILCLWAERRTLIRIEVTTDSIRFAVTGLMRLGTHFSSKVIATEEIRLRGRGTPRTTTVLSAARAACLGACDAAALLATSIATGTARIATGLGARTARSGRIAITEGIINRRIIVIPNDTIPSCLTSTCRIGVQVRCITPHTGHHFVIHCLVFGISIAPHPTTDLTEGLIIRRRGAGRGAGRQAGRGDGRGDGRGNGRRARRIAG